MTLMMSTPRLMANMLRVVPESQTFLIAYSDGPTIVPSDNWMEFGNPTFTSVTAPVLDVLLTLVVHDETKTVAVASATVTRTRLRLHVTPRLA